MIYVKTKTFEELSKLVGEKLHFKSDCEFFPNFDVKVKLLNFNIKNSEFIFNCKVLSNKKKLTIGSNMKNLRYEIIQ